MKYSEGIFSNNQPCPHGEDGFFGPPNVQEGLQDYSFLILDGNQHPKTIWFRGC